ncbi:Hemerythrin HHE cation binding domain-containing protein [Raineyella antarctica]|uniref:Hemerythrin HHE cation binding domain-containing protein n=1 Tax=Raineyella antarctica TaxID=1577474 RepID=A0A1G6GP22_9ACTN|nr:hemerythrin domain-containing protein [Raineyella antarctica]SDB83669.1 Hemerythrin HHE cation binding domain-containing protein [Raineyella antarctica]
MDEQTVGAILEAEHRSIDEDIVRFGNGEMPDEAFRASMDLLRRHIYVEEAMMFPQLREAGLVMPIMVMEREHGEIWSVLDALQTAITDGSAGADVTGDLEALTTLLENHNAKEEPIVYPVANRALSSYDATVIKDFLASGTMPYGWTCARAV